MIDLRLIEKKGCTTERLRQIFTAKAIDKEKADVLPDDEYDALPENKRSGKIPQSMADRADSDVKTRELWEEKISSRIDDSIQLSLNNFRLLAAVDLAWDSTPISKATYPLMLYAMDRIGQEQCIKDLSDLPSSGAYLKKDKESGQISIDVPAFFEVNVSLVRAYVTRRLAAQTNRTNSLYPYYRYHARSTSDVSKLKAEVMSQRAEQVVDEFGYRAHDNQVFRDTLLYAWSVDFVRARWEKEKVLRSDPKTGDEVVDVTSDGLGWVNPHPTRVFFDRSQPISSINYTNGCQWLGYWDVVRYKDIRNCDRYWNKTTIGYSDFWIDAPNTYGQYWNQYYCDLKWPKNPSEIDSAASSNDSKAVGFYNDDIEDTSTQIAVYYERIIPSEHGMGNYHYPVWVRFVVAGCYGTVIYAEFLPSRPAAYCGYNCKDDRVANASFGMQLMQYQDQLTNLFTQLMAESKRLMFTAMGVNTDFFQNPEDIQKVMEDLQSENWYSKPTVIPHSFTKIQRLGVNNADPVRVYKADGSVAGLNAIWQNITLLLNTVERLEAFSANEAAQPITRSNGGVSATEALQISGTTEAIHNFISDGFEQFIAAKKRILAESLLACGERRFEAPVINRYPRSVIQRSGFIPVDDVGGSGSNTQEEDVPRRWTVRGNLADLDYSYIYSSREGNERYNKTQVSQTLLQLLPALVQGPITKGQFAQMLNAIMRNSGAGEDIIIEVPDSEADMPVSGDSEQEKLNQQAQMQQLVAAVQQNAQDITKVYDLIQQMVSDQQRASSDALTAQ